MSNPRFRGLVARCTMVKALLPVGPLATCLVFVALFALNGCDGNGIYVVKNPKVFLSTIEITVNGSRDQSVLEGNEKIARNVWLELNPGDNIAISTLKYIFTENSAPDGAYVYARAYLVTQSTKDGLELGSEILTSQKVALRQGTNAIPIGSNPLSIPEGVTDLYVEIFSYPGAADPQKEEKVGKIIAMIKPADASLSHNIARNAFNTATVHARTKKENEWLKGW